MTTIDEHGEPELLDLRHAGVEAGSRARRRIGVLLVSLSLLLGACTQGEIEQTLGMLSQSFEDAGLEGALSTASWIAPEVAMRVGSRLGGLGF